MGKLLPTFRKSIIDEIIKNISSNTSNYYAYVANPIAYTGITPPVMDDDYNNYFMNTWSILFGKKITILDVVPVIDNKPWIANTVYSKYDDRDPFLHTSNFYVVSAPDNPGGFYHIFKCLDNANGAPSTVKPSLVQSSTFQTEPDKYKWRYIASVSWKNYEKFGTDDYCPLYVNTSIVSTAQSQAGVEIVHIVSGGSGYAAYHEGVVESVINSTAIQIQNNANTLNEYYTRNSIYIYNTTVAESQLLGVSKYVSNTSGKWIYFDQEANTDHINPGISQYKIAPKVVFSTDGDSQPVAYCTINAVSNSVNSIIILDKGSNITRANAHIESNTVYGSGANLQAIVPPQQGHGSNPLVELDVKGLAINFRFANTEGNTIVTSNVLYNKIGLVQDPYSLSANGSAKESKFSGNTFSQVLKANVYPGIAFTPGDTVIGETSNCVGIVVFSNTTQLYLAGDKTFENGEYVISANGLNRTTISINDRGDIYAKDLNPLYIQNINNLNRSDAQTESFKLIIQV